MTKEQMDALDSYFRLCIEIAKAGTPPHTDFWHQSIWEREQKIKEAFSLPDKLLDRVKRASGGYLNELEEALLWSDLIAWSEGKE